MVARIRRASERKLKVLLGGPVPLPGGDFSVDGFDALVVRLHDDFPFLSHFCARRLIRAYGTEAWNMMAGAASKEDLGEHFGSGLRAREVIWLMENEFARTAEDVVWRRNKLGLRMTKKEIAALDVFMQQQVEHVRSAAAE